MTMGNVRRWDLGDGLILWVWTPMGMTKCNLEKLKRYVAALEVESSIAWEDENLRPAATPARASLEELLQDPDHMSPGALRSALIAAQAEISAGKARIAIAQARIAELEALIAAKPGA